MADVPSTRLSLVARLRDAGDHAAWAAFVRLYAPAVYRFARRHGLQDADAADLTQDVLRGVAGPVDRLGIDLAGVLAHGGRGEVGPGSRRRAEPDGRRRLPRPQPGDGPAQGRDRFAKG